MNETTPATTDVTTDAIISDFWRSSSPSSKIEKQLRDSGTYVADFRQ